MKMKQLDLDIFDNLIPNTHYKNLKTEIIDNKSQQHSMDKTDYSKINCSTKDLLKEKDKKIEILQEQMLQLQKKLDQQKTNNNYKAFNNNNCNSANNINYTNLNCNTSANFPLKTEIKKIWEELALVSLLDNFIDYEKQPEIIFHLVSEIVLITDKLISELCLDMYQKVSQSLNIINDKKFINDIEKTSRPLIKEHLNKTFAGTNNQQFIDKVINLFKKSVKKIFGDRGGEENGSGEEEKIGEVAEGADFKLMIKKIKDILLFTKFNDQQLFFRIEKDYNKRIVEKIKIKNNYEKKNYLIINDNNKEDIEGVIILKPPVLRSGFPLNNDFKTIIILSEKEGNNKSYKNLTNINKNNNQIDSNNGKINKIVGLHIKKILPNLKNINNNIEIKIDEYNNCNNGIDKQDIKNKTNMIYNEKIINTVFSKEQRNSYQKLTKNMNLNIKYKEDKNNYKTDFNNSKKDQKAINEDKDNNEENSIILNINTIKYKNRIKNKGNLSNDNRLNEKRNITTNKKHRPQLSDQILKNNSSKNLFDYIHQDLLNNSSSKKYQNKHKVTNNSFNQKHFITYNNNDMKSIISLNNYTDNENNNYNETDNEENNDNKEIIFHTNTAKGVLNLPNNLNNDNKKQRNTNNNDNISKLNQIYFNQNENNIINNNKGKTIYNQLKEKLYTKNSLNKLNKKNNGKNILANNNINNNLNDNNKNYKKINSQKRNNNNQTKNSKNNDCFYKTNSIYEKSDTKDNEYNKLRITGVDLYNDENNLKQSKIEMNNLYIQNNSKIEYINNNNTNNINNQYEKDLILFKKNKTATLISNKIKTNKNDKKVFKIIPLIKMKTQQNQNKDNISNTNNTNNTNINITPSNYNNINYNQNRRNSNRIKYNKQHNSNNKIIEIENANNIADNYRKIKNNKNINNYIVDNNNNVGQLNSKKNFNFEKSNENRINDMNNINNKNFEDNTGNKIFLFNNKHNNHQIDKNQKINNNSSNKEKNYRKEKEVNYAEIRNNNLIENNIFDYNDINNTGYKIKNVNINYFNIMQPNKLYINQNSTRSKSRPSDCERNKILINYNNYNKNILQNYSQNNNIKNISYKSNENNFNNNKLLFNRVNNNINKKKNSSQESSNRININNNINNMNDINNPNNYSNNRLNKLNNYHYKLNLVKNNTNNKLDSYNINKNPLSIITDLTNIDKITEQIKNEKRVLIKIKGHKQNKISGIKEEKFNSENNKEKNNDEKNSLIIGDINNQSSNNTSRKKNKCRILNNKHASYVKIPKKIYNNEMRPASGGMRYIEKNYNKFNSEYINQISNNFNNNNELDEMKESYVFSEKERNSIQNKNNKINKQNKINESNNINYYDNKNRNIQNNKSNYGFNGMNTYNYNSFRKNNKFN